MLLLPKLDLYLFLRSYPGKDIRRATFLKSPWVLILTPSHWAWLCTLGHKQKFRFGPSFVQRDSYGELFNRLDLRPQRFENAWLETHCRLWKNPTLPRPHAIADTLYVLFPRFQFLLYMTSLTGRFQTFLHRDFHVIKLWISCFIRLNYWDHLRRCTWEGPLFFFSFFLDGRTIFHIDIYRSI